MFLRFCKLFVSRPALRFTYPRDSAHGCEVKFYFLMSEVKDEQAT